jgi:hypothetical protein
VALSYRKRIRRPPAPIDPYGGKIGDKHFAVEDLQLKDNGYGGIGGVARIKNVGSISLTLTYTFTFFQNDEIVGTARGCAANVAPGRTVTRLILSPRDKMIYGQFFYEFQVDSEF